VGPRHSKAEILDGALAAALEDGLSQLTFGRLAKRLGMSDRTIVYYFPSKEDLVGEVILAMGAQPLDELSASIKDKVVAVHVIGDALEPQRVLQATASAAEVARQI